MLFGVRCSHPLARVVVADGHPYFRDGVTRGLLLSGRVQVVAEAGNGREALEAIRRECPDVALLDHEMPELDGLDVLRVTLRDELPTRVLLLSAHTDSALVFQAFEEGAAGCLTKDAGGPEIVEAVLEVARGRTFVPADLAAGLAGEIRRRARPHTHAPVLGEGEREVLRAYARRLSASQVAAELFVEEGTVKTRTLQIFEKLGVSDPAAAVAEATRRGLLR
jgi:two-component system nitrate/nitrite response regulator NarL